MKTISIFFLSLFFLFSTFSLESVKLATEEYPPYTSNKISHNGYIAKIVTMAFAAVDYQVEYQFYPGARSFKLAKIGELVGTVPWSHRKEREEFFYYSRPVAVADTEVFFVLNDSNFSWDPSKQSYEDLKGISIGGVRSYNYGDRFQDAENSGLIKVSRVNDVRQNFRKLFNKRLDVVISHKQVAMHHLNNTFSKSHMYRIKSFPVKTEEQKFYYILFSKKNPKGEEMKNKFNEGLSIIKRNGLFDEILQDLKDGRFIEINQ
ncbi:hypothetical protein A9Q84_04715 [Halobacteriovorax marinus]|uniref:Solute-binding protein family 3/N-terminal domain-containing protein n=1 Tax=Halobacteriovorax marinus TaxID=97084 RepID=A0A1Y5FAM3_9BACT|nr:hypothetical protein A9Q84_04715 [Halobacteriovorax marinus]